ncbi:MAG: 23S rRNA (uracil(1939)-C(5))-methyltransferase RlmD [Finegoldia sp.]|nr:23S rRNA (uracil(1939)-C(5))-methyltransferase RlmD [Finegoldia sp.]
MAYKARKRQVIEGTIEENVFPNRGLVKIDESLYSIKNTIKGQKVSFVKKKKKGDFIDSKLVDILEKSPLETEEGCPVNQKCGGCIYQRLPYETECDLKFSSLKKLYQDIYDGEPVFNPSVKVTAYRNKMEYSFGDSEKGGPLVIGLHSKGRFYDICNCIDCNIVDETFNKIRESLQDYFREKGYPYYKKIAHTGILRHLIIRKSFYNDEYMVNLVTTSEFEDTADFVDFTRSIDKRIVSIFHTINDNDSDAVVVDKLIHLYGKEYLSENILGLDFRISPFSFFQPNPAQASLIYKKALDLAGDLEGKEVYDLYCGTGTIAQIFAKSAKSVTGVEIVEEAVVKAIENANLNGLTNTKFVAADCLDYMDQVEKKDVIVLDPPRDGIHPKAIDRLIDINPEKFIYISCNPVSQKRDLEKFLERGYEIKALEFFDQFPRTYHVESVSLLERII